MRLRLLSAVATLTLAGCLSYAPPARSLSVLADVARASDPEGLSGLTWVSNSVYYAVSDRGGELWELELPAADGDFTPQLRRLAQLEGAVDLEAVAFDRLAGTVWAADEANSTICEYALPTGRRLRSLELPAEFRRRREGLGLESLAISSDGRTLVFANEEALEGDGPTAVARQGTRVRICRYRRESAAETWRRSGSWAYATDPVRGWAYDGLLYGGVAEMFFAPDGTLWVAERELSRWLWPHFSLRLYSVQLPEAATELPERLEGAAVEPLAKRLEWGENTLWTMYEGLAFGPATAGGRRLVAVSDGGGPARERLRVWRQEKPHPRP